MVAALVLLLVCLGFVLYRDRDFWFPGTEEIADQSLQSPLGTTETIATESRQDAPREKKAPARRTVHPRVAKPTVTAAAAEESVPPTTVTRTVLPPLEVEVVAGSSHRKVRPGSNSLKVDLEQGQPQAEQQSSIRDEAPPTATINAAEHAAITAEPSDVVTRAVQPGYPLLARQMKVEGSVILQALIGRNGLIQDLQVVSGPPILATAAREAVKQWHFKPHYEGADAVETQAKITVNFTISTN